MDPAAMPGASHFAELRGHAPGNTSQAGEPRACMALLSLSEHEWSSPRSSCHPSQRAAQEQALQPRLVKNNESSLAACIVSRGTKEKENTPQAL